VFHIWAVSEGYIVIIGASIPALAPLWRRGKRTASDLRSYEMYGNGQSRSQTAIRGGKSQTVSNVQKTVVEAGSPLPGYSSISQEHILAPEKDEIVRTVVVDLSYT
jgi:hypothetical protein